MAPFENHFENILYFILVSVWKNEVRIKENWSFENIVTWNIYPLFLASVNRLIARVEESI